MKRRTLIRRLWHACNAHLQELSRQLVPRLIRTVFKASRARRGSLDRTGIRSILICRNLHRLGDSITLTPLLEELATDFPGAQVDIIGGYPAAQALYGSHANVRRIFLLPEHVASHPLPTLRVLRALRCERHDLAIDPDLRSQSSRLLVLYAGAERKLGLVSPHKSGLLSHDVDASGAPRHRTMVAIYLVRTALGGDTTRRACPLPDLRFGATEREEGRALLVRVNETEGIANPAPCIGLFAGGSRGRSMGSDWWQRFLAAFEPCASTYRLIEILPPSGRSLLQDRYPRYGSPDVRKLAAVLANFTLFVSADCGVMHLAWATGAPTIGLFKVTNAAEWGPWGGRHQAIDVRGATPEQVAVEIAHGIQGIPTSTCDASGAGAPRQRARAKCARTAFSSRGSMR